MKPAALLFALASVLPLRAQQPPAETMAEHTLKQIVEHQREVFAEAEQQGAKGDPEALRVQAQELAHEYESLLQGSPNFAAGYVAYAELLYKVDMDKEATALMQRADEIDPTIPLVKNRLGNFFAEEGRPLDALPYFQAAIRLDPQESTYQYDLGKLLSLARDDFLRSGWPPEMLYGTIHEAFRRAAQLAPDNFAFTYSYAQSFADLARPDWDAAFRVWLMLEQKAPTPYEKQVLRLQEAYVRFRQGRPAEAGDLLATVTDPKLQVQKQKLVAQLPAPEKN